MKYGLQVRLRDKDRLKMFSVERGVCYRRVWDSNMKAVADLLVNWKKMGFWCSNEHKVNFVPFRYNSMVRS